MYSGVLSTTCGSVRRVATLTDKAAAFRALLRPTDPLILANIWDAATAVVVVEAGAPALASTSAAVAAAHGYPDSDVMPADVAFQAIATVARAVPELPLSADLEAGYQLAPAELVERLLGAGAVGCNIEDTDHHGGEMLVDARAHADRLRHIRSAADDAGVAVVLNARIDVFIRGGDAPLVELLPKALDRCHRYLQAGADTVYPIAVTDDAAIARLVEATDGMVNVWARSDAPPVGRLRELGVARVSVATGLFNAAMRAVHDQATLLYGGD